MKAEVCHYQDMDKFGDDPSTTEVTETDFQLSQEGWKIVNINGKGGHHAVDAHVRNHIGGTDDDTEDTSDFEILTDDGDVTLDACDALIAANPSALD